MDTTENAPRHLTRDEDGYVTGEVTVGLDDLVENDLEGLLDILSLGLVGSPLLMDVNYKAVRIADDGSSVVMEVTGDASMVEQTGDIGSGDQADS